MRKELIVATVEQTPNSRSRTRKRSNQEAFQPGYLPLNMCYYSTKVLASDIIKHRNEPGTAFHVIANELIGAAHTTTHNQHEMLFAHVIVYNLEARFRALEPVTSALDEADAANTLHYELINIYRLWSADASCVARVQHHADANDDKFEILPVPFDRLILIIVLLTLLVNQHQPTWKSAARVLENIWTQLLMILKTLEGSSI